jgi:hypothetical protein
MIGSKIETDRVSFFIIYGFKEFEITATPVNDKSITRYIPSIH